MKKIYARYGFTDLKVDAKIDVEKYVQVHLHDKDKVIGEIETSLIGFEFEDGTECNEDGTEL